MANVVTSIHQPRGAASSDWQVLEAELSRSKAMIYVSGVWSEVGKDNKCIGHWHYGNTSINFDRVDD